MSAQPESDTLETRVENAIIRELNKVAAIQALKPDHWDSERPYELPLFKVKVSLGRELIPYYGVYAFRVELELRSKPKKEEGLSVAWLAARRLIEDTELDLKLTDDYTFIGAPAEDITTPPSSVAGDERVRMLRCTLRGYSKI